MNRNKICNQFEAISPMLIGCLFGAEFWTLVCCETSYVLKTPDEGSILRLRGGSKVSAQNLSTGHVVSESMPASTMHINRSATLKPHLQSGNSAKRLRPDGDDQLSTPPSHLDNSRIPSAKKNENGEIYFEVMRLLTFPIICGLKASRPPRSIT
jgi:hypothetical protein